MSSNNEKTMFFLSCVELKAINVTSTETTCDSHEFDCGSGYCVPGSFRCNGYHECGDSRDEIGCGMFNVMCCITHNKTYC